jgi:hypothetical protein
MDDFQKNLEKLSVQPYKKEQGSIYDQISSIMGNKPKYSNVQAAVKDMQDRSGLTDYLKKVNSLNKSQNEKVASDNELSDIDLSFLGPSANEIKQSIDNVVVQNKGALDVMAVLERLKKHYSSEVQDSSQWDNPSLLKYIKDQSEKAKKDTGNAGNAAGIMSGALDSNDVVDRSNTDAFHALNPASTGK